MKLLTGDDWFLFLTALTKDTVLLEKIGLYFYFLSFIIVVNIGVANMLILTFVNNFEEYYLNGKNPILNFDSDLKHFKKCWKVYAAPPHYAYIPSSQMINFLKKLDSLKKITKAKTHEEFLCEMEKMRVIL